MKDQRDDSTQVQLGEPVNLLGLLNRIVGKELQKKHGDVKAAAH